MALPPAGAAAPRPIFIHGSGGDHRVWAHQAACFAGGAFIDLPGHPTGIAATDAAELAGMLAGALDQIGDPGVLVGHSLGGAIALQLALARPDLVRGLVLIATGARLPVPEWVMRSLEADFEGECARLVEGFFSAPDAVEVPVAEALAACGPGTLAADYAACRSVDLRDELGAITAPTLVIAGADDPLTPPWFARELADGLVDAELAVIDGMRHMPMVEAPAAVNLLIGGFLAEVEALG